MPKQSVNLNKKGKRARHRRDHPHTQCSGGLRKGESVMSTTKKVIGFTLDAETNDMIYAMRQFPKYQRLSKSEIVRQLIVSGLETAREEAAAKETANAQQP